MALALFATTARVCAADDFLPPEVAFRFEAKAIDARNVELTFNVAEGYYLYRERFAFAADGASLGAPAIAAGKVKFDETFQKDVETHRGRVAIRLPVQAAPASFTLRVTGQGCADQGLCYPPMESLATVRLVGFGGDGQVAVLAPGTEVAAAGTPPATAMAAAAGANLPDGGIADALRTGRFWAVAGVFFAAGLLLSFTKGYPFSSTGPTMAAWTRSNPLPVRTTRRRGSSSKTGLRVTKRAQLTWSG